MTALRIDPKRDFLLWLWMSIVNTLRTMPLRIGHGVNDDAFRWAYQPNALVLREMSTEFP